MYVTGDDVARLILAVLAGGLIGLEREYRDKAAGFRTLIFICVGAALFTILSSKLALDKDPTRIAANIVSGVGFLGAGVILREGGRVVGLTTAAAIWLTAAVGMALGGGSYALAGVALGVALVVLWILPLVEDWVDDIREERMYEITCGLSLEKAASLANVFAANGVRVKERHQVKADDRMTCRWRTSGRPKAHERLVNQLFTDPEILELRF